MRQLVTLHLRQKAEDWMLALGALPLDSASAPPLA